ncbi:hypothetical protein BaRGS_00000599 [Batillaria attramentaria]|uniref:Uncharacterized protein n=1 Tax=Batillaria attramentaria TaxID=370345 RepID=A0ABD0M9Q3_9CAEN
MPRETTLARPWEFFPFCVKWHLGDWFIGRATMDALGEFLSETLMKNHLKVKLFLTSGMQAICQRDKNRTQSHKML